MSKTLNELQHGIPLRYTTASLNDTLQTICFQVYGKHDAKLIHVLSQLNMRHDWDNIEVGAVIMFPAESDLENYFEVIN